MLFLTLIGLFVELLVVCVYTFYFTIATRDVVTSSWRGVRHFTINTVVLALFIGWLIGVIALNVHIFNHLF